MTHREAMSGRDAPDAIDPDPGCPERLVFVGSELRGELDCFFWAYSCPRCGVEIGTVEGRPDPRNRVIRVGVPEDLDIPF